MTKTTPEKVETVQMKQATKRKKLELKQPRAFALAILLLVVFGGLVWFQRRQTTAELSASPAPSITPEASITDQDFLNEMIPHHQEAVDASKYMLENSDNDEIKKISQSIVDQQSKEIWVMIGFHQLWLKKNYPGSTGYMKMMPDLTQFSGVELDKAYVRGMITHHQEAVKIAQSVSETTRIPELKTLATEMMIRQVEELKTLTNWLNNNP